MSFFSRSKSKGHYPGSGHGSGYYKRPHGSGGFLGKLFKALMGSVSHSRSGSHHYGGHTSNHNDEHSTHHRGHKSSWS